MEVLHILLQCLFLAAGAGVLRGLAVLGHTAGIHNVAAHAVVPLGSVGHFPGIHLRILVVVHQAFHTALQVEQVGVAHLFPTSATLAYGRSVPLPDVRR